MQFCIEEQRQTVDKTESLYYRAVVYGVTGMRPVFTGRWTLDHKLARDDARFYLMEVEDA